MAQRSFPVAYNTDKARWEAVLKRDRAAGNAFVYTVSSTGIYCRPTCPARVARRANVGFYEHASEAATKGFRPCKRCKPELTDGQPEDAAITAVKTFVANEELSRKYQTLRQMADQAGLSKWHFHRTFVKVTGLTPGEWAKQQNQRQSSAPSSVDSFGSPDFQDIDFNAASLFDSLVPTTPLTSFAQGDGFDAMHPLDTTDEDWLKMIDFDAVCESVKWDSFQV